jgi:hypothetical protein
MNAKSAFLNGYINEKVYVDQPPDLMTRNPTCVQVEEGIICLEANT